MAHDEMPLDEALKHVRLDELFEPNEDERPERAPEAREALPKLKPRFHPRDIANTVREMEAEDRAREALWQLLDLYGSHWSECAIMVPGGRCTCGYDDARRALLALLSPSPAPETREADPVAWLAEENRRLKQAGDALSVAATRVTEEYDGVHRLRLAVAAWNRAVADEGGRGSP